MNSINPVSFCGEKANLKKGEKVITNINDYINGFNIASQVPKEELKIVTMNAVVTRNKSFLQGLAGYLAKIGKK